jgi:hypothetical protein
MGSAVALFAIRPRRPSVRRSRLGALTTALALLIPAGAALALPATAYGSCSDALSLTPKTQTQPPGGSATVTATLSCGGAAVSGQGVTLDIKTGPDKGFTASGTTSSTGQASFTVDNGSHGGGIDVGYAKTTTTTPAVSAGGLSIYWQTASLNVTPSTALPGQAVAFTGSGYAAGETVDLYANSASGQLLTTVTAGSTGAISGSFTVPAASVISLGAVGATSGKQGWAVFSQPCADTWINTAGGSWGTTADWSTGALPSGTACITEPGTYTVTLTGGAGASSLIVGAPSGTTTQTLELLASGQYSLLSLGHTSYIDKTGALVMESADANDVYLESTDTKAGPPIALIVKGLFETVQGGGGYRYIYASLTISGGRMVIDALHTLCKDDKANHNPYIDNNGTLSVDGGDNLDLGPGATYTQGSAGRLNVVVNAKFATTYGLIDSGVISLSGTLGVKTYGTPSAGESFTVISGTSVTGTFSSISSPVSYTPVYSPTTVALTA